MWQMIKIIRKELNNKCKACISVYFDKAVYKSGNKIISCAAF